MSEFETIEVSQVLSIISHPVAIITTKKGEKMNGMTAAWVCQISIDPPIMCVSISPLRHTWEMLEKTDYFGVSLLGDGQERIAEVFGTVSGRDTNKFGVLGIEPIIGKEDVPLIPGSLAAFVCKKKDAVEMGDHFAVFGEVVEAWKGRETPPLRWHRSKFDK